MTKISDILSSKDPVVYTINSTTSVKSALTLMAEKGIGALIVKDDQAIVGIFSERDFARKTLTIDHFKLSLPVQELMSTPVFFITPDQSLEECMTLMTEKRIRHIPVMQNDQLVGIVSIRDVVKWLMADKTYVIKELERFVYSPPVEDYDA